MKSNKINIRNKVIEIETPSGSTACAFTLDKSGNIIELKNLTIADIDGDYLFETEKKLLRLQMDEPMQ